MYAIGLHARGVCQLVFPTCQITVQKSMAQLYEYDHYVNDRVLEVTLLITSQKVPNADLSYPTPYYFAEEGYMDIDGVRYVVGYQQRIWLDKDQAMRVVFLVEWRLPGRKATVVVNYILSSKGLKMTLSDVYTSGERWKGEISGVPETPLQKPIEPSGEKSRRIFSPKKTGPVWTIKPRFYCSSVAPLARGDPIEDFMEPLCDWFYPTTAHALRRIQQYVRKDSRAQVMIKFIFYKNRCFDFFDTYYTNPLCQHLDCKCRLHLRGKHAILYGFDHWLDLPIDESVIKDAVSAIIRFLAHTDNFVDEFREITGFIPYIHSWKRVTLDTSEVALQTADECLDRVKNDKGVTSKGRWILATAHRHWIPFGKSGYLRLKLGKSKAIFHVKTYRELAEILQCKRDEKLSGLVWVLRESKFRLYRSVRIRRRCSCQYCAPVRESMILRVLCPSEI